MSLLVDRRFRRSSDPLVALHYQLAQSRSEQEIDAIVVADEAGVVVAGAGAWATCEELAAYAPLLADGGWNEPAALSPSRLAQVQRRAQICSLRIEGQKVHLCATGQPRPQAMDRAALGVARILGGTS